MKVFYVPKQTRDIFVTDSRCLENIVDKVTKMFEQGEESNFD